MTAEVLCNWRVMVQVLYAKIISFHTYAGGIRYRQYSKVFRKAKSTYQYAT